MKYQYRKLERIEDGSGKRLYVISEDDVVSSVTTILSDTGDPSHLEAWRARIGRSEAQRITTESAGLGTLVHKHIENHLTGKDRPRGNNHIRQMATAMADQIIEKGLPHIDKLWGVEATVYAKGLYAGTADIIGIYKGQPTIIDIKTARKIKKEEWIEEYKMQISAYALAHNEMFGTNIEQAVILMSSRCPKFKEFIIKGDQFWHYADLWSKRLSDFYTINNP